MNECIVRQGRRGLLSLMEAGTSALFTFGVDGGGVAVQVQGAAVTSAQLGDAPVARFYGPSSAKCMGNC